MGQNDDRTVRFSGIKPGAYTYEMLLDDTFFDGFENEEIKGGKVHFDVKMERSERVTMLTFVFDGEVRTECDRCLGEMTVRVSGEEQLNVRFSDSEVTDDEQVVILPEDARELELTPWLYEFVAVRLPLQHSHPEGECDPEMVKYLVDEEQMHAEDYMDPRWEALKELK
ncbi:MAG: DUF177 domain-containing protein [Bacteroidales bacterium]|nr:DUF177 domain-containing protein [Bacteroidales bacterium]